MKMTRFLAGACTVTLFCLVYVYQQTEIVRLAYAAQKKTIRAQDIVEENARLRFAIDQRASPVQLGARIFKSEDFQMPDSYRLVQVQQAKMPQEPPRTESLAVRLFGIKRQAQARTIGPGPVSVEAFE